MSTLPATPAVKPWVFFYGPMGSGKTSIARALARHFDLPCYELDERIEAQAGKTISEIFLSHGEGFFRNLESACLQSILESPPGVVALGGGALLDSVNRSRVDSVGQVICLHAQATVLLSRLTTEYAARPLLGDDPDQLSSRLHSILAVRAAHYASFPLQLDTTDISIGEATLQAQALLGKFRICSMGTPYFVHVQNGSLGNCAALVREAQLSDHAALVTDENVAALYLDSIRTSFLRSGGTFAPICIPVGESGKTLATITHIWDGLLQAQIERSNLLVAAGGGVVTDLGGFAAATFLRGIPWAAAPTTLLGMIDAALGGKTGFDLPQGKNLIGAFYPPRLVIADPATLQSLPLEELRNGMAELIKHAVIADPALIPLAKEVWEDSVSRRFNPTRLSTLVRRGMTVKIRVIEADPYEKGARAVLNFGHSIGHALEAASEYRLRHGEAVAIGMVMEARQAERMHIAPAGLAHELTCILGSFGLPVEIPPSLNRAHMFAALKTDKKRAGGVVQFALPVRIGEVRPGISVPIDELTWLEEQ